jgi:hypothetical protein
MKNQLVRTALFGLVFSLTSMGEVNQSDAASAIQSLSGAVFVLTNKTADNQVIAFDRAPNGLL